MRAGFPPLLRMVMERAVEEGLEEMSWPIVRGSGDWGEGVFVFRLGDGTEATGGCEALFAVDGEAGYARDGAGVEDTG